MIRECVTWALTGEKKCMVATYNFGSAYTDGVDPEQAALTRAVRSVSALFSKALKTASIALKCVIYYTF